jgi:hypothetical protein
MCIIKIKDDSNGETGEMKWSGCEWLKELYKDKGF